MESRPDEALLRGSELSKRFGGLVALRSVSVNVRPGEVLGIIGPNGSGKTTLFNLLSGFARPDAGRVNWLGHDVTKVPSYRRARRGLVRTFQDAMVFSALTVQENAQLAFEAARLCDRVPLHPREAVDYVGLSRMRTTLAGDLSWGQTRLLGIALALIPRPLLLLLDEPFAGLSPPAAADITAVVRRIFADGVSLCIIDHELDYLLPVCGRLVVLVNGVVLADGVPSEVLQISDVRSAYLGL